MSRTLRVVHIFLLVLVAAVIAGVGFGNSSDAAHAAVGTSWSQPVSVGDTDSNHSDSEFCAALCATAGAATPIHDSLVVVEVRFRTERPTPAAVAIPQRESPAPPSLLGLLGILRI